MSSRNEVVIGIAGCGGIGSNCAVNLIRRGYSKFVIADFDRIEESNLNRQFFFKTQIGQSKAETLKENLLLINPDAEIRFHDIKLDSSNVENLFDGCDALVEALDCKSAKAMFLEAANALSRAKVIAGASGIAGTDPESMSIRKLNSRNYICGDFQSDVVDIEVTSAKVTAAAALMASVVDRKLEGVL